MQLSKPDRTSFHRTLIDYYSVSGRHDMLWRLPDNNGEFDPYKILVSEIMLQQTGVERVTAKYSEFLQIFPTVQALAAAPLSDVLVVWNGLGYNRRAKYIWQAAQLVQSRYKGTFPHDMEGLQSLPGVGPNTAGAIMAYAYNQPVVFVETNVRTVIIHNFFEGQSAVGDAEIRAVMVDLVPWNDDVQFELQSPREFYWALMDYGSFLKKTVGNVSRASKHYAKQSQFAGSKRQIRGQVIRLLTMAPQGRAELGEHIIDERLDGVLIELEHEGFIAVHGERYCLA